MSVFEVIFVLAMLLLPGVFTLFYGPRPDTDRVRVRRLRVRLWTWTAIALVAFAALAMLRNSPVLAGWFKLPWITTMGRSLHEYMWLAFFPLWFALAMPLIVACRPEASTPYRGPKRSASLTPRTAAPIVPRLAWFALGAVWLTATLVCLRHWPHESHAVLAVSLSLGCGLFALVVTGTAAKRTLCEPEPLDSNGSKELREAYGALRRVRSWGFYGLGASLLLLSVAIAVLTALGMPQAISWGGAIGGSLIGIGGATFGVVAANRRMQIHRKNVS